METFDAAPPGIAPVADARRVTGRVLPARHYGSVDVFLEAFGRARQGDVLVVDNGGRTDEACIGDLAVLEARAARLAGVVVWGLHRDTPELADRSPGVELRPTARRRSAGHSARRQTQFEDYLARCADDPAYTFRRHLRRIAGAIEE